MMRKALAWALMAFVVFYVIKNPVQAASTAQHVANGAGRVATSFGEFVTHLSGGAK